MTEAGGLKVDIASKTYRTAEGGRLRALGPVAFDVPNGSFVCMVGPSGCGKSTTLRLVLDLDADFEGRIERPPGRMAAVFQEPRLLPWRTVERNVRLALAGDAESMDLAPLFEQLGLAGTEALYPRELSLGMARRVALARAFAVAPALLVLDEPFVSLDDATAARMRALLVSVWRARPTTVLLVTHVIGEAIELADEIVVLSQRPGSLRGSFPIAIPRERRDPAIVARLSEEFLTRFPSI